MKPLLLLLLLVSLRVDPSIPLLAPDCQLCDGQTDLTAPAFAAREGTIIAAVKNVSTRSVIRIDPFLNVNDGQQCNDVDVIRPSGLPARGRGESE